MPLQAFDLIKLHFEPLGFECYTFKISEYNSKVEDKFQLNYDANTIGVFILNTPLMFEKAFLPFLEASKNSIDILCDPIDKCMNLHFNQMKQTLIENGYDVDIIQDYELTTTRRAKILLQTVAHVSGAAYFYQKSMLDDDKTKKHSMGVCLHPKYGGWFAMRGVFILKNVQIQDLISKQPIDVLNNDKKLIEDLLNRFNNNWKDNTYRDVIQVDQKYSQKQIDYFLTEPKDRKTLINKWLNDKKILD